MYEAIEDLVEAEVTDEMLKQFKAYLEKDTWTWVRDNGKCFTEWLREQKTN